MSHSRLVWVLALLGLLWTGEARADVPPPPPRIPGTTVAVPDAVPVLILGVVLSLAIGVIGLATLRSLGVKSKKAWVVVPATVIALATTIFAIWAAMARAEHDRELREFRPLGPVRRFIPDQPPVTAPPPTAEAR